MKLKTGKRFRKARELSLDSPGFARFLRWSEHTRYDRIHIAGRNAPGSTIAPSKLGRGRWRR